jgi:OOP family OmpA-OmpF porin
MSMQSRFTRAVLSLSLFLTFAPAIAADAPLRDLAGAKDPPYVGRFAGSAIVGYGEIGFGDVQFPMTNEVDNRHFVKSVTVEGKVTRVAYLAPTGKSRLEVQRNYQEALTKAGFVKKFSCDGDACGRSARINEPLIPYAEHMKQLQGYGRQSDPAFLVLNTDRDPHYIWGTLKADGRDVAVAIFISVLNGSDDDPLKDRVGVFVETVEPKAMETGQVTVDAGAMKKGLAADGRIALYGVYFDTGKADVKPESKPQLDEMAKLLDADKSIKVFIVGHTDNQGALDANVALSQRRAEAIVAALTRDYKVDPKRLVAKGVANLAPIASNDAEAGRTKNRRVELVRQ